MSRDSWYLRSHATVVLLGAMASAPRLTRAQVFEVQGGGSSFNQAYGGALNVWGDRFEGNVGLGYLDGLRFSAFLKRLIGRDTVRLGNDAIPVRFATDVFGSSHTILAQGAGARRASKRSLLYGFVGASASATPAPFVNALRQDQLIGVIQGERALSPYVRLTTHALFSSRQTVLQGIHWESPNGLEVGATAGVGGNQPYGSMSAALKHQTLEVRVSYVGMGDRFRRTGVPTPAQSEADRENVLITWRPMEGVSVGAGRQHFRQDSVLPGMPDRAALNQAFATARLLRTNLGAGVFDSRTTGVQSVSSYFTASRDFTRWLETDLSLLRVWSPGPSRSTIPILRLREFISPRLSLLQVVTRANGRTTASLGGALTSGLTSLGLDYQVVHTPYRPTEPFVQTVALTVRIPLGNYRISAASFVLPDGRVSYTGSTSTFFYAGDVLSGSTRPVEIKFERYIVHGAVVDESGTAIDGAAIEIGGTAVFTDSRGRFFHRLSGTRAVPLRVLFDDFLTPGRFELIAAPTSVTPRVERESTAVRVVVRRVPPERTESESSLAGRSSPND